MEKIQTINENNSTPLTKSFAYSQKKKLKHIQELSNLHKEVSQFQLVGFSSKA